MLRNSFRWADVQLYGMWYLYCILWWCVCAEDCLVSYHVTTTGNNDGIFQFPATLCSRRKTVHKKLLLVIRNGSIILLPPVRDQPCSGNSGSPRKRYKVTPSAGKVFAIMLKCLWGAIWGKRAFWMKVWLSSIPTPDCTCHSNLLQKFWWQMLDHPSYSPNLAPSDEDVRCATIMWLIQQVIHSVCLGWANWSHTMTSSSIIKGTMFKNNVPVTPSLCNVSFLFKTWSSTYGYYKLTLLSTFMFVTDDLSQAVSNHYIILYNNSTI